MKPTFIILFVFTLAYAAGAQGNTEVAAIRNELFYDKFDKDKSKSFYKKINELKERSPLMEAYKGAAQALLANFEWNPLEKIGHIRSSSKTLEEAVRKDMKNIEIRFLRFYIQNQIPKYLGLSNNIHEDRQAIMDNILAFNAKELGYDITDYIINYMITSGGCSEEEVTLLKAALTP